MGRRRVHNGFKQYETYTIYDIIERDIATNQSAGRIDAPALQILWQTGERT
jgi:hypothetical protein